MATVLAATDGPPLQSADGARAAADLGGRPVRACVVSRGMRWLGSWRCHSGLLAAAGSSGAGSRAGLIPRSQPGFTPPGPALDVATALAGKTIYEIPITSEIPFATVVEQGMEQASELVGAKVVVLHNRGQPGGVGRGHEDGDRPEGRRAPPRRRKTPRSSARRSSRPRRRGSPSWWSVRRARESRAPRRVRRACRAPSEQAGRLEADWAISRWDGRAGILVITSNDACSPPLR